MAVILDGKLTSQNVREKIRAEVDLIPEGTRRPGLAVIIVGDDSASHVYVRNKKKGCEEVGFLSREYALPAETTEEELISLVRELNHDNEIDGILVQLPLPSHLDDKKIIENIDPSKDVDAFSYHNVGRITVGDYDFLPCTPAGVMELLDAYGIDPSGKSAVVVGRSNIVGKPQALLLLQANATVTVAHTADMVKDGAVVIDVGMDRDENGKLCGDVDFESVKEKASYITPVPGGVGPMTITELLKNTLTAYKRHMKD